MQLSGVLVLFFLCYKAMLLVEHDFAVVLHVHKICVAFGDDCCSRVAVGLCEAFNIEFVAVFFDAYVDAVGVVCEPLFGILHLVFWHCQHFEAAHGVAVCYGHSHRYGQTYHAGAWNADAHGVFEDVLTEFESH